MVRVTVDMLSLPTNPLAVKYAEDVCGEVIEEPAAFGGPVATIVKLALLIVNVPCT